MALTCEVIAIASEVLAGYTINSNASWISKQLHSLGFTVNHHQVVGDDPLAITEALNLAASRADVVFTSGGLGPTADDRTRSVLADYFSAPLCLNKEILSALELRYAGRNVSLENQATQPSADHIFANTIGTAPGLLFKKPSSLFFFLPGVPVEMKEMMKRNVLPYLRQNVPTQAVPFIQQVHLFQVPESEVDPLMRELQSQHPGMEIGSYPGPGTLTLLFSSNQDQQAVESSAARLKSRYPQQAFEAESGEIEEAIHRLFCSKGWTLSSAESCTGGGIASLITSRPGASSFFLGSVVSYANTVKSRILGVSEADLLRYGAVSQPVVQQMAEGVRTLTGSSHAIATSGIAGPAGGSQEKPVGTLWIGLAIEGRETICKKIAINSSREGFINRAIRLALVQLWSASNG